MVGIRTAKSFCGCQLRVPCIVLASIRMVVYIVAVLAYLYFFVVLDAVFKEKQNRNFKNYQIDILIRVLVYVVSVNIFVTILFIVGVKTKSPAKMEYYLVVVGLNAVLMAFLFKIELVTFAVIDCFILFYSYSLYKEYSCQDGAMNTVYRTVDTTIMNENDLSSLPSASADFGAPPKYSL